MKERPILVSALILTIIVEVVIMILVYNRIGGERLPYQGIRLGIQLVLIFWVLGSKSNVALFLISAYHIVSGLVILNSGNSAEVLGSAMLQYHILVGLVIYFHDWLELKVGVKTIPEEQDSDPSTT